MEPKNNKIKIKCQKNCINDKEKNKNTTTKGNEMRKLQPQQHKKCQTKMNRNMPQHRL